MQLLRTATVTVCTLALLSAVGVAYHARTRAAVRDISRNPEPSAVVPVGSRLESAATPAQSSETDSDATPADPHARQQPTLAPPEEDLKPFFPTDPALSGHLPPRPGRHVVYVPVEARQVPPENDEEREVAISIGK